MHRSADRTAEDALFPAAPPLRLPAEHFAAALVFLVLGAIGLVAIAPELAVGAFFGPHVIATVHLFTLGWIALSIFGALCQFLPVAIGLPLRWRRLVDVTFALQVAGLAGFVDGLLYGHAFVLDAAAGALSSAFALFAVNLGVTLATVKERTLTWWALAGATLFLVVTPVYGSLLELDLRDGRFGAHRFHVVALHAHIAIVGIALLVIVGVAHRLIPMFLLSHGAGDRAARVSVALLFSGAVLLAVPAARDVLDPVAGALVAGGILAFAVQAAAFFRHRTRRALDPGMRLAAAGILGLLGAAIVGPIALARGMGDLHLLVMYFVVLLGAITVFIAGHYYKIVPFLIWYHRFGPLVGVRDVPKVSELFSQTAARVDTVLLVGGWLGLVWSTQAGSVELARISALVFAAGVGLEAVIVAQIARRRP